MNVPVWLNAWKRLITFFVIPVFCGSALSSCSLLALQKNVEIYQQYVRVSGRLENPSSEKKPVIIFLYQVHDKQKRIVSYGIYHKPDRFQFMVLPGQYFIEAFEDANQDLIYQVHEWAGYYGSPSVITMRPGQDQLNLDVTLQPPGVTQLKEFPNLSSHANQSRLRPPHRRLGEVVTLNDSRFAKEKGRIGLWEPLRFMDEVASGLFPLKPFDSEKIPVLFVHGGGGTPREWTAIIQKMNREMFQPWLFYYPSGIHLDDSTELLWQSMSQLSLTYKFPKLIVVAHSMGGMIARAAINRTIQKGRGHELPLLFVTLSTPWGGHQGAQMALDYSTIGVIPSWIDLAPDSPFQQKLFETHLSPAIHHYLFFSYKGHRNFFTQGNNDGAVSLASQLHEKAQSSAVKVLGFNEDHASILTSRTMIVRLNEIMKNFVKRKSNAK